MPNTSLSSNSALVQSEAPHRRVVSRRVKDLAVATDRRRADRRYVPGWTGLYDDLRRYSARLAEARSED